MYILEYIFVRNGVAFGLHAWSGGPYPCEGVGELAFWLFETTFNDSNELDLFANFIVQGCKNFGWLVVLIFGMKVS